MMQFVLLVILVAAGFQLGRLFKRNTRTDHYMIPADSVSDTGFIENYDRVANESFRNSEVHGFHEEPINFGEKVVLVHSELSEVVESFRKGDPADDHIPEFKGSEAEFADTIIRIMDIGKLFGLRIPEAVLAKQKYNATRPFKHGGKKF